MSRYTAAGLAPAQLRLYLFEYPGPISEAYSPRLIFFFL